MTREKRRATVIKIAEIIDQWTEENGLETSAAMEIELAHSIVREVFENEK